MNHKPPFPVFRCPAAFGRNLSSAVLMRESHVTPPLLTQALAGTSALASRSTSLLWAKGFRASRRGLNSGCRVKVAEFGRLPS